MPSSSKPQIPSIELSAPASTPPHSNQNTPTPANTSFRDPQAAGTPRGNNPYAAREQDHDDFRKKDDSMSAEEDSGRSSGESKPLRHHPTFGSSTTFAVTSDSPESKSGDAIEDRYKAALREAKEEVYDVKHGGGFHDHGSGPYANAGEKAFALAAEEDSPRQEKKGHQFGNRLDADGYDAKTDGTMSTATGESDFDWDSGDDTDDDDLGGTKKEKKEDEDAVARKKVARAKRLRWLYLGCIRLSRPVRFTLFALIGGGIFITPALVMWTHYGSLPRGVRANVLIWSIWFTAIWIAGCVTSIVVDLIPSLIFRVAFLILGHAPEMLKTHVEILMATSAWLKLFLDVIWAWVSLGVICGIDFFQQSRASDLDYFDRVFNVVQGLFATALIITLEKYLLQYIAFNFHQTAVRDRLEENGRALWALDKLAAAKERRKLRTRQGSHAFVGEQYGHGHSRSGHGGSSGGILSALHSTFASRNPTPTHSRPGSPSPGKALSLAEQVKQERDYSADSETAPARGYDREKKHVKLETVVNMDGPPQHADSPQVEGKEGQKEKRGIKKLTKRALRRAAKKREERNKTWGEALSDALAAATLKPAKSRRAAANSVSARRLARKLFEGLSHDRDHLEVDDFYPYFDKEEDAVSAFGIFDKDGNGDISKREMREAVQRIYKERRALSASLKDMSSAVTKLDMVLLFVALLIIIFVWLLVFNPTQTIASFVPLATIVLGLSFVFGNSAKNIFESMIFVFQVHPYDVGDLVFIDDQPLMVKEFGLLSTTFCRVDGQIIIAPNSILSTEKFILNVRRSASMWETTQVHIAFDTPLEAMDDLRSKLRGYVGENNREWGGGLDLNVADMSRQNMITLTVAMQHKGNWQDWGARWDRRTKLMKAMKRFMDELQMTYSLPLQPVAFHPSSGPSPFRAGSQGGHSPSPTAQNFGGPRRQQSMRATLRPVDTGNAGRLQSVPSPRGNQGDYGPLRVDTRQTFRPRGAGDMDAGA